MKTWDWMEFMDRCHPPAVLWCNDAISPDLCPACNAVEAGTHVRADDPECRQWNAPVIAKHREIDHWEDGKPILKPVIQSHRPYKGKKP